MKQLTGSIGASLSEFAVPGGPAGPTGPYKDNMQMNLLTIHSVANIEAPNV